MAVRFDDHRMWVDLSDGRVLGVPLAWFPRLMNASPDERRAVEISAFGLRLERRSARTSPSPAFSPAAGTRRWSEERHDRGAAMPQVDSSMIAFLDYDEGARELQVVFHATGTYLYSGVPKTLYAALLAAPSKGSFFNDMIRDQYPFIRIGRRKRR